MRIDSVRFRCPGEAPGKHGVLAVVFIESVLSGSGTVFWSTLN